MKKCLKSNYQIANLGLFPFTAKGGCEMQLIVFNAQRLSDKWTGNNFAWILNATKSMPEPAAPYWREK